MHSIRSIQREVDQRQCQEAYIKWTDKDQDPIGKYYRQNGNTAAIWFF